MNHFSAERTKDATVLLNNEDYEIITNETELGYAASSVNATQVIFFNKAYPSNLINVIYE